MKKILLLLILNLAVSSSVPALAATKLPPGRVPERRPLQPAPENEFPEYLEAVEPAPIDESSNEQTGSQIGDNQNSTTPNNSETTAPNSESATENTPLTSQKFFWIIVIVLLLAGGAVASFQIEKKK